MAFYQFPEKALVNRNIPKTKFYEHANITKAVKDAFVSQIQQITWTYKLSPESTNLAAIKGLFEIEVFNILLKTAELNEGVLQSIDKSIPHPILYQLFFEDKIRVVLAYKRISDADEAKWVVEKYLSSEWFNIDEADGLKQQLPIALNLGGLYEQLLKKLMPIEPNDGESVREQTLRLNEILEKQKTIEQLQRKIKNEKQFNRRVEINSQLKALEKELAKLRQKN